MTRPTLWLALTLLVLTPQADADTIDATASTSGSLTFVSFLSAPGPGFAAQFSPLPTVIANSVGTTGSGTGSTSGFITHDAVDPNDVQPGESISWATGAMGSAGPGAGTADVAFDVAGNLLFFNPNATAVDVRVRFDFVVSADATIDGPTADGLTFTDFQVTNPEVSDFFVFADFGDTVTDSLTLDVTVPGAVPGANGVISVPFFSGSTLALTVPEPRAATLLATAVGGVMWRRRARAGASERTRTNR